MVFDKLLTVGSGKLSKELNSIVDAINKLEEEFEGYSDDAIKDGFRSLKEKVEENILFAEVEGFAYVREAAKRTLNQRHYDVQLFGGLVLLRNKIAENLFNAWYSPFYKFGVIHGDPHPGNYTICDNGKKINLLDFGCIRVFNPKFVAGVIKLYKALVNNDNNEAAKAYKNWGFKNLNNNLVNALNIWALYLYGPLLENRIRKIQDHHGASYGKELLGKVRKELKKYGGVKPPKEFVLVDRAAIGLGSVFMHLKAELNWHRKFQELIRGFSTTKVLSNQKKLTKLSY